MTESTRTVREFALAIPGATRIFEKLGIDYCCGGGQSLADACAAPASRWMKSSVRLRPKRVPSQPPPTRIGKTASHKDLIAHIVEKHHTYTREELARLDALLTKVCGVHGQNHPELFHIQHQFRKLRGDLEPHMLKEENVLFPYIIRMEEATVESKPLPTPPLMWRKAANHG